MVWPAEGAGGSSPRSHLRLANTVSLSWVCSSKIEPTRGGFGEGIRTAVCASWRNSLVGSPRTILLSNAA